MEEKHRSHQHFIGVLEKVRDMFDAVHDDQANMLDPQGPVESTGKKKFDHRVVQTSNSSEWIRTNSS